MSTVRRNVRPRVYKVTTEDTIPDTANEILIRTGHAVSLRQVETTAALLGEFKSVNRIEKEDSLGKLHVDYRVIYKAAESVALAQGLTINTSAKEEIAFLSAWKVEIRLLKETSENEHIADPILLRIRYAQLRLRSKEQLLALGCQPQEQPTSRRGEKRRLENTSTPEASPQRPQRADEVDLVLEDDE